MAQNYNFGDLKGAIDGIYREVVAEQESGEAPNTVVLTRLKHERKNLIDAFTPQLVDMALTKLLNDVCNRSAARSSSEQDADLFGDYPKVQAKLTVVRGLKKPIGKMTIAQVKQWLARHTKPSASDEYDDYHRLINDCEDFAQSDQETIEQALARKQERQIRQAKLL